MTKLSGVLGCDNLLHVEIEGSLEGGSAALHALHDFLLSALDVCGRRFQYLLHKVEHSANAAKLIFVAVGPSVKRNVGNHPPPWPSVGGSAYSWESAAEARSLMAPFELLPPPKMAKRMQLTLSTTCPCLTQYSMVVVRDGGTRLEKLAPPADPGILQVVEWDEIYGDVTAADGGTGEGVTRMVMTNGAGRISLDLARRITPVEGGRRLLTDGMTGGMGDDDNESAPLLMQARLWYGSVAKGQWVVDSSLPERTLLVGRQAQRKLDAPPGCAAEVAGTFSFEVIRTWEKPRRVRLDVYLAPLLEAAVEHKGLDALHTLMLLRQRDEAQEYLTMSERSLSRRARRKHLVSMLEDREAAPRAASLVELIRAGFDPLSEPYIALELAKVQKDALASLKAGRLTLPDSFMLPGIPDFTGSLLPGEVAVVVHGKTLPRPLGLTEAQPHELLVYGERPPHPPRPFCRPTLSHYAADLTLPLHAPHSPLPAASPGMHPGDLRKVRLKYPEALLASIRGTDPCRSHAIFFSTRGSRPLADEIAGSDYDGDEFAVIGWTELVRLVAQPTASYDPKTAPQLPAAPPTRRCPPKPAPSSTGLGLLSQQQAMPSAAALRRHRALPLEASGAPQLERSLVSNYLMARFMSGAIVGTAGVQWMIHADRLGANHRKCLLVCHARTRVPAAWHAWRARHTWHAR